MEDHNIPINRALLWILVSILFISGSAFMGWQYYLHAREKKFQDEQYKVVALVQSTPQSEGLNTVYLAELLELSVDRPVNLYQFSVREAERKLMDNPLIKQAVVRKILPGTVYVDYQMRTPIAYVGDYANTAIDEAGYIFPFRPFFTPKRLPTFYFGLDTTTMSWGCCLNSNPLLPLVLTLTQELARLESLKLIVKLVDVTQAKADSYGQRQLIVVLEEMPVDWTNPESKSRTYYLRLSTDNFKQNLENFRTLYESFGEGAGAEKVKGGEPMIIDLRVPHLAFIKQGS